MSVMKASRLLATTAVAAGMILSGVSLAIAEEASETPDFTVHSEVTDVTTIEGEDVVHEDGKLETEMPPVEIEDATEEVADAVLIEVEKTSEESGREEPTGADFSPVPRNAPSKSKPTKVE